MPPALFQRLIDNLKSDGVLTTAPLIYEDEVLSGNHRVQAAIKAGIESADCIEVTSPLTKSQRIAIQLSHNSIEGQDDPNTLRELYESLDFDTKFYSGLSDDVFNKIEPLDIGSLAIGTPKYQDLNTLFLPADKEQFEAALKRIEQGAKRKHPPSVHLAMLDDFNKFFDSIIAVKEWNGVHNSAIAMRIMANLAVERLEQLETEDGQTEE